MESAPSFHRTWHGHWQWESWPLFRYRQLLIVGAIGRWLVVIDGRSRWRPALLLIPLLREPQLLRVKLQLPYFARLQVVDKHVMEAYDCLVHVVNVLWLEHAHLDKPKGRSCIGTDKVSR